VRRFFASLNVLGWLLVLLTGAATLGFLFALNNWHTGFNAPGWPWHVPNRPVWTRADYLLVPLFALLFFWGSGCCLARLGFAVFRDDGSTDDVEGQGGGKGNKRKKRKQGRK
jgi:hypothetical protein